MSQQSEYQLFPIRITKTQKIEWTHSPRLPSPYNKNNILQHNRAALWKERNSNSKYFHRSAFVSFLCFNRDMTHLHRALCNVVHVSFHFSLLSLPFNPVTSTAWAGEVSQRLSHGLRANPTPRALPEGRPSVRSVWSVLGGKASAAWPNSTFQHTPPLWWKAQSIYSTQHTHMPRAHTHTQLVPKHKQINKQTDRCDSSHSRDPQSKTLTHILSYFNI